MSYVRQIAQPEYEPVGLDEAKNFCKIPDTVHADDELVKVLIGAARKHAENWTARAIAQRQFVMVLDSHPYYTDSVQSQLAYPPNYYSLPKYSTTLWNYSQMIKVPYPPLKTVDEMRYIATDGSAHVLVADTDFVVDRITECARLFPIPGQYWPADLYVANAVQITFTAGYDPDPKSTVDSHTSLGTNQQPDSNVILAIPQTLRVAILMLVAHWYANREPVAAGSVGTIPNHVNDLLWSESVIDFAPNRG
jgi:hypothetical protein